MNDPLILRFAQACGATGPLDLRIDLVDGGVLAEGTVQQPFTLIGRDDACDVTLTDPDVNPRHTWLQVLGGRVFAVDLGSRAGLVWPSGAAGSGWLDPGSPVRLGPFRIQLRTPTPAIVSDHAPTDPLRPDPALIDTRPVVQLDFRNAKRMKDRWTVNRDVTLIGRSEACKIHLGADDISAYHCGLVLTPAGLWVVDLSGRGVVVNGERMRVAPLSHGSELWVGRFLIGCHCPGESNPAAAGIPIPPSSRPQHATQPPVPEDEVPLGQQPAPDPAAELPSSHILAGAFGHWPADDRAGPVSNPITVSGTGPPSPPPSPAPPPAARVTHATEPTGAASSATPDTPHAAPPNEAAFLPLLRHLSEIHGQMFDQFQQSLLLVVQAFGQMHREQMSVMQAELSRIQELNLELGKLQAEVARLAVAQALGGKPVLPQPKSYTHTPLPGDRPTPSGSRPGLGTPAPSDSMTAESPVATAAIHEWVIGRINALQQERQSRWQKLVGIFTPGPSDEGFA